VSETRYQIADTKGQVQAIHARFDYADGSKRMWWEQADGTKGLGGTNPADLPPYGAHEWQPGRPTLHLEGEKARDALALLAAEIGINVVGHVTGAPKAHSAESLREILSPLHYLWADSDAVGETQMARTHDTLFDIMDETRGIDRSQANESIRRIVWSGARDGKGDDGADFVASGGTAADLQRLIDAASPWDAGSDAQSTAKPERQINFMTAREFSAQTPPETEWVVGPYVPVGGIVKVDGPPKKAGKTTLITHMIRAVLDGTPFLGQATKQGPVVLLSEQGGTSLREAFGRAGLLDYDTLYLALYRDMAGVSWPEIVADAADLAEEVGAVLLVVDTLPACSGVRGDDENSAGRALEALEPLQVVADQHRLGVITSFHDRKGGGEVGDSGRGSTAYAGAVDIILHLTRPGGNFGDGIRKIEALSRFEATPPELYIELTPTGYIALGAEEDVVTAALARMLPEVLPKSEDAAVRVESVKDKESGEVIERGLLDDIRATGVAVGRSTLDLELKRWLDAGYVGRTGTARKGSPLRYWLIAMPPDAFFRSKPQGASKESNAPQGAEEADTEAKSTTVGQMHSFDAPSPSKERNGHHAGKSDPTAIHSFDGPDPYSERKNGSPPVGVRWERL